MKKRTSELREYIRQVLLELSTGGSIGVDPQSVDVTPKGFYPYDVQRGVDIQSFWYKSPGRAMGGDGDPGRPSNASEYIGMTPPESKEGAEGASEAGSGAQPGGTEELKF